MTETKQDYLLPIKGSRTATWFLSLTSEDLARIKKADKTLLLKEVQEYISRYANIISTTVHDNNAVQKFRNDRNLLIELTQKLR